MPRIMALDVGEATLGVALSDPLGVTARPLLTIRRSGLKRDFDAIAGLAREHEVSAIVVGLPLTLSGETGPAARKALAFSDALGRALSLPVHTWDERLTTVQAERSLLEGDVRRSRRRDVINHVAAALILQSWLDRGGGSVS